MSNNRWTKVLGLSAGIIAALSVLGFQTPAWATSGYDNVVITTDTVSAGWTSTPSCTINLTNNWESVVRDSLSGADQISFDNRVAWNVVEVSATDDEVNWSKHVQVQWWESNQLPVQLEFRTPSQTRPGYKILAADGGKRVNIGASWPSCTAVTSGVMTFTPTIVGYQDAYTSYKVHESVGAGISYPPGYDGEIIPNGGSYVALGDSYSSGEGSFNYIDDGTNCHRSINSYPYLLAGANASLNLVACSGAITDDLYSTNLADPSETAQMLHVTQDTAKITLTIGGNDLGFSDIAKACANHAQNVGYGCSSNSTLDTLIDDRIGALAGTSTNTVNAPGTSRKIHSLAQILTDLAAKAPDAEIYVAGYPKLFGTNTSQLTADGDAPGAYKCVVTQGSGFTVSYGLWDIEWLNSIADRLNETIEEAVEEIQPLNVTYVPLDDFEGHGLCDTENTYVNGIVFDGLTSVANESLHPNIEGMGFGYASSFTYMMQ